jgi:hypothetical protein
MTNEALAAIAFSLGILLGTLGYVVGYVVAHRQASAFRPIGRPLPQPRRAPALFQGIASGGLGGFRAVEQRGAGVAGPLCWTCGRPKTVGTHPNC